MAPVLGGHTAWSVIAQHTRLFVAFGGLPSRTQVNYGGLWTTTCGLYAAMAAASVDSSRSPLKDDAPGVLKPRHRDPAGTDTAFMMALSHTLLVEGLLDEGFLARYCTGFERFRPYLSGASDGQPKDADCAATITGVAADVIRELARKMATVRTMLSSSWSIQRADHGEQPYWMLITLAAMLGQIGLPGGGFGFGYGAVNNIGKGTRPLPLPSLPTGRNPTERVVPVARVTDMLLAGPAFDFNGQKLTYPTSGLSLVRRQCSITAGPNRRRPAQARDHHRAGLWWTPTAAPTSSCRGATIEQRHAAPSADRMWFAMVRATAWPARTDYDICRVGRSPGRQGRLPKAAASATEDTLRQARQAVSRLGVELPGFEEFEMPHYLATSGRPRS